MAPRRKNDQTLEEIIANYWNDQFEAFQLDGGGGDDEGTIRANKILKDVQLLGLNHGVATLGRDSGRDNNHTQDPSRILTNLIVENYAPACLSVAATTEQVDEIEVTKRLLELMAVIVIQLSAAVPVPVPVPGEAHVDRFIQLATDASLALSDSVRAVACALLGYLGASEALIPRLTDKSIGVRAAAMAAAGRILMTEEDSSSLLEALLWNVWHDPSVSNRVVAVQALPVKDDVWDHVIARLRDVKEKVRGAAMQVLQRTQSLNQLTSAQMAEILQSGMGLEARCQVTKDALTRLICSHWMKLAKYNALNLLKAIDVLANDEEAEYVLRVLLSVMSSSSQSDYLASLSLPEQRAFQSSISSQLITLDENNELFTLEQFFLARVAASCNEEYLAKVVPDMGVLCDTFQLYSQKLLFAISEGDPEQKDRSLFVCLQLLQLATLAGMTEEGSRRRFSSLLQAILMTPPAVEIPDEMIEAAIKALLTLHGVEGKAKDITFGNRQDDSIVATVLQDIMNYLTGLSEQDPSMNPLCTLRILSILSIVLEEVSPTSDGMRDFLNGVAPTIHNVVNDSDDAILREAAVSCLGKLGLFTDKAVILNDHKPLLLMMASNEDESLTVRSQAMMALSDWALVFDEILRPLESGLCLVDILKNLLKSTHSSVAAIAAEASAKLLFSNRLCDSSLIAPLLVLFFDPNTKESTSTEIGSTTRMQQWLSLFFPAYCLKSGQARDALLGSIETALMLALTKPFEKKKTKKRCLFPMVKLVEYVCEVVTLAQEETLKTSADKGVAELEDDARTAFMIALQIAKFILSAEEKELSMNVTQLRSLCKLLGSLTVPSTPGISKLQQALEELGMVLTDGTSLRSLTPLIQELEELHPEEDENIGSHERRESNASTVTEATGLDSNASTITEISNKENPSLPSSQTAKPSSDYKASAPSSRLTRNALKSQNTGA